MSNKPDKNELNSYLEILNKLLELEKKPSKKSLKESFIKKTICIVGGLGSLMFIGILCYSLIKSDFSLDSILSTLLAFFSIFISIFFYFKADETSADFYNSSYQFMKDISVTLGKIEERFGEKLNNLNDKLSHLDNINIECSRKIQEQTNDKDKLINDLMDKANLSENERNEYKNKLTKAEEQIELLTIQQIQAKREADKLRKSISEISLGGKNMFNNDSTNILFSPETAKFLVRWVNDHADSKIKLDKEGMIIPTVDIENQDAF